MYSAHLGTGLFVLAWPVDAVGRHALEVVLLVAVVLVVVLAAVQERDLVEHRPAQALLGALLACVSANTHTDARMHTGRNKTQMA